MKYGVFFVNVGAFSKPQAFGHLVTTAEKYGMESLWTVEHVVIPVGYHATYPYDPSGKIPIPTDMALPDPLLPLAYAAAITTKIKLATGIVILPQRHPFYMAKEAATLDQLSNGRFLLGVGVGWLEDEFQALGIPFKERGARTDETIRAMRSLWKPQPEAFASKFFNWGPVEMNPKPIHPDGVPIVIGGHSAGSARRAARFGNGFFPALNAPQEIIALKKIIDAECHTLGRDPSEIEITALLPKADPALVDAMAAVGVSRLLIGYGMGGDTSPSKIEDWLGNFAKKMID
ncbi:MAG: LLM class F420-dependent oxidoreductase [Gammaproteobacteria bacterium]|nr:LLM class F420-dependent oxidoreductase [Gammaproteobacteria bacterium]